MIAGAGEDREDLEDFPPVRMSSYDIFLLALVAYSALNLVLLILPLEKYQTKVVLIMDAFVGVLFLFDFIYRFIKAPNRREYFFRENGWLDLLAGVPAPGFRLAKLFRLYPTILEWQRQGVIKGMRRTSSNRAMVSLLAAVFCTLLVIQFGSMLVIGPELRAEGSNITTAEEAIWWSYVTVTTVGYGDYYPVSGAGRLVGILLLTLGIALFAVITGFLANAFIFPRSQRLADEQRRSQQDAAIESVRKEVADLKAEIQLLMEEMRRSSEGTEK